MQMLKAVKSVDEVLQSPEISESTLYSCRSQYGVMKSEAVEQLEEENHRLKKLADYQHKLFNCVLIRATPNC